jgi:hypothetical protein
MMPRFAFAFEKLDDICCSKTFNELHKFSQIPVSKCLLFNVQGSNNIHKWKNFVVGDPL